MFKRSMIAVFVRKAQLSLCRAGLRRPGCPILSQGGRLSIVGMLAESLALKLLNR